MKLKGYSDYEIFPETGKVWSYKRNKFVGCKHNNGYWFVNLGDDFGVYKHWSIHRLVWTVVNGEIPEGMTINHNDENKDNNSISNLSLMTQAENNIWGTRMERIITPQSKPVIALNNNMIHYYFRSIKMAHKENQFGEKEIIKCAKGVYKQHKGYKWMYLDDYLADWWEQEMEKGA